MCARIRHIIKNEDSSVDAMVLIMSLSRCCCILSREWNITQDYKTCGSRLVSVWRSPRQQRWHSFLLTKSDPYITSLSLHMLLSIGYVVRMGCLVFPAIIGDQYYLILLERIWNYHHRHLLSQNQLYMHSLQEQGEQVSFRSQIATKLRAWDPHPPSFPRLALF